MTDKLEIYYQVDPAEMEVIEGIPPEDIQQTANLPLAGQLKLSPLELLNKLGAWHLYLEAEKRALEAKYRPLIDAMTDDLKHLARKQEHVERLISVLLPPSREAELVGEQARLFYTPSESVEVEDPEALPIDYLIRLEPKPDRKAIKAAIAAGLEVPGCKITRNWNLQVKEAGPRALHNAKARQRRFETQDPSYKWPDQEEKR